MNKEFHWFVDYNILTWQRLHDMTGPNQDMKGRIEACFSYNDTFDAIYLKNCDYIYSTQSHFFSQDTIDKGYRLFIHINPNEVIEVKRGENTCTKRKIRPGHNLEKLLYAGEFGNI